MARLPNMRAELARIGMSRDAFAAKLGVTRKTLWNWEQHGVPKKWWERLSQVLGAPAEYLLMREEASSDGDV